MTAFALPGPVQSASRTAAAQRVATTNDVTTKFFGEHADAIAQTCQAMAARFERGGRLLVCGDDTQSSDVAHVVVEFMHPVVVGKRALPALSLPGIASGAAHRALAAAGREHDMLMVFTAQMFDGPAEALLAAGRAMGVLTIVLTGGGGRTMARTTHPHTFVVPSPDACIVQETHEMLYHVLWELVHVFFDHRTLGSAHDA